MTLALLGLLNLESGKSLYGIKLIFDSCIKAHIKKPDYTEGPDSVKIIFDFIPETSVMTSDQDKLLLLFEFKKEISIKEVKKYLNVSRNIATRKLNQLVNADKIYRVGKGPAIRYIKKNNF